MRFGEIWSALWPQLPNSFSVFFQFTLVLQLHLYHTCSYERVCILTLCRSEMV